VNAVIFKINQLGDNVVFLPVAQRLVEESVFDSLRLWTTPVAEPLYRPLQPRISLEVVPYEVFYPAWKKPLYLLSLARKARRNHPDLALVAEDMGNTAFFLGLASGAKKRLGIRPPYLKIPRAINAEVPLEPDAPAAEKAWTLGSALVHAAGGPPWPQTPPPPDLRHLLRKAEPCDILIHAGASRPYKRWSLERFHELATRLARDFRVGWIDTPDTPPPSHPGIFPVRPPDLESLVSLLSATSLFIGNNSGPMNIASALGTPSLILVGPSTRSWNPYWHAERFRVLRHEALPCIACDPPGLSIREICTNTENPMACMKYWTVDRVEAEARQWIDKWTPLRQ
jgi:ADP-heptose:LPS heptosyltransferase